MSFTIGSMFATTNAPGTFSVTTDGFVQGTFQQDPVERQSLAGGYLLPTDVLPMWGGVAIFEDIPTPGQAALGGTLLPADTQGGGVGRAAAPVANITGFSVFDQAHHMVIWPGNPVPLVGAYGSVHFFRLGSVTRVCVKCDPALATLEGGLITQQVSWDFAGQMLVPFNAAWNSNVITASSWSNTNGGQFSWTTTTNHGVAVGEWFNITGETPSAYNGDFQALAGTTGSTLIAKGPATTPGASTVQGTLQAGGGALPVKVLKLNIGNSLTVDFNTTTGVATWNRSGSCAVILI